MAAVGRARSAGIADPGGTRGRLRRPPFAARAGSGTRGGGAGRDLGGDWAGGAAHLGEPAQEPERARQHLVRAGGRRLAAEPRERGRGRLRLQDGPEDEEPPAPLGGVAGLGQPLGKLAESVLPRKIRECTRAAPASSIRAKRQRAPAESAQSQATTAIASGLNLPCSGFDPQARAQERAGIATRSCETGSALPRTSSAPPHASHIPTRVARPAADLGAWPLAREEDGPLVLEERVVERAEPLPRPAQGEVPDGFPEPARGEQERGALPHARRPLAAHRLRHGPPPPPGPRGRVCADGRSAPRGGLGPQPPQQPRELARPRVVHARPILAAFSAPRAQELLKHTRCIVFGESGENRAVYSPLGLRR